MQNDKILYKCVCTFDKLRRQNTPEMPHIKAEFAALF